VSDELRHYPADLLSAALDVRSATLHVTPGTGTGAVSPGALPTSGDPVSRLLSTLDRHFADLAGGALTPAVVAGAVLLALLLGAGHAALPGHGKTVMAAYLAGRRGRPRDALAVAGTVTLTHTGGVLILGLVITAGSAIAGERVLGWLGVVSGVMVVLVGAGMLRSVLRRRTHHQDHHHPHGHTHDHDHPHPHPHSRWALAGIGIAGGLVPSPSALVVLLAAIGLGRAAFGVLLVVLYGAGMAATLAGTGLLLVGVQRRLAGRLPRLRGLTARFSAAAPTATAALVLVVGAGLALRAATALA
jgi:ABC-type nickel/cobalt efflux system permease component RcnA